MQTKIHKRWNKIPAVQEAETILRSCVHCGFCTATCPTYQELSDERDGPRGRIYLIKQFLETGTLTERSRRHLDRCLACRSCETTCPSGVRYGRLLDIGRALAEQTLPRGWLARAQRYLLRTIVPKPKRFRTLLRVAHLFKPVLPKSLQKQVPPLVSANTWPAQRHNRVMLVLQGCVQSVSSPQTNEAATRVLDRLGISLVVAPDAGCCGALTHHLSHEQSTLLAIRQNIDAWWPAVEAGAEAIVVTASGCGVTVKEYGKLLAADPQYAEKAACVSAIAKDIAEVIACEDVNSLAVKLPKKTALHCPCSLQHGQKLPDIVEQLALRMGANLAKTQEKHLCCGSAGSYSLLQPELSERLLTRKLAALAADNPEQIVTANIGCQLHLGAHADVPVKHWIEWLDEALS
ncbi:glycolate oxidase subunit GlcF [Neptunomonas marina]|uniref:Glycolate oxidase iron-sulfur subunit n=1 Tax=Neptunomonas marina TaxID=1815562 RepID=A0A437QAM1_9GAMM|nr:glycolate oxidase subunit GlcF [Neptunomonas marina]RVU31612.1 glycolate oxidase iron-sulfur subunit [Neptunomonas marina]